MKTLIIGANGKIGKILSEKLSRSSDYTPTAFIRKTEQKTYFDTLGIPVIVESLAAEEAALENVIKGFEAIIFTAGSGGQTGYDKTLEIDLDGAVKAMNAAAKNGIKRFIMISAAYADVRSFWATSQIKPYYIAKHFADNALRLSGLDYTILRPVRLTDEAGTGMITAASEPFALQKTISRTDVADTAMQLLGLPAAIGKTIEISAGETPITAALQNVCND